MRHWMLLAVACAAATACGGQVSGSPDGGTSADARASSSSSGSGSGSGSGGPSGPVPLCLPDPPTVGTSCVSPGQGCAYLIDGQCEGYRCSSTSGWKMDPTVTCP